MRRVTCDHMECERCVGSSFDRSEDGGSSISLNLLSKFGFCAALWATPVFKMATSLNLSKIYGYGCSLTFCNFIDIGVTARKMCDHETVPNECGQSTRSRAHVRACKARL